ncbi:hypothetical protein [Clostridium septicum]|uniref:Uncharacterized protein n=1 Tax=Clostridium septicum TaxID=1504 RepID=A0A9N7PM01_CLOSE|nr:hypothetical protein [Clostridium septicum]AYE34412.1 hypothetical protein CP523_08225 [Clostridium septicum]MDU1312525.1 hypothetical protein [Clostridium septicum]QAS59817.1 hypothetical protein EI377_02975 [Clostridium septicum]UEC20944.1 hypothetical protein LK444_00535 [Clostridium septicum]USS01008.1 hypothetical protein NH397_00560 [Clostridium septicum]
MKYNSDMIYLSDEEIKRLTIYLAYGVGLGVLSGIFMDNIIFGFSLGGVISIIIALLICFINKVSKNTLDKKR